MKCSDPQRPSRRFCGRCHSPDSRPPRRPFVSISDFLGPALAWAQVSCHTEYGSNGVAVADCEHIPAPVVLISLPGFLAHQFAVRPTSWSVSRRSRAVGRTMRFACSLCRRVNGAASFERPASHLRPPPAPPHDTGGIHPAAAAGGRVAACPFSLGVPKGAIPCKSTNEP